MASCRVHRHTEVIFLTSEEWRTMRTTLTLDEDVADFLRAQSRLHDKPFKQVVNEVLRRGMAPGPQGPEPPRFRVVPNPSGLAPGVDPLRLNQLNDQLEVEDFAAESGQ